MSLRQGRESPQDSPQGEGLRGDMLLAPAGVAIVRLHKLGRGTGRTSRELSCSRKRYLESGGWVVYRRPRRQRQLEGFEDWLRERFRQHHGNCDVVRQDLSRGHCIEVSLLTVERALAPLRQALRAGARASVRFETPPGE